MLAASWNLNSKTVYISVKTYIVSSKQKIYCEKV